MVELLIIACLMGDPSRCEEFDLRFAEPTGMKMCMYKAQFRLAEWATTMPNWAIKRWTCGLPRT